MARNFFSWVDQRARRDDFDVGYHGRHEQGGSFQLVSAGTRTSQVP